MRLCFLSSIFYINFNGVNTKTDTMQLKPGSLICGGKYRIEKVLGQGGFGITYLAEQTSLGRRVALKEFFMKEHCDRETSTSYVTVPSAGSRELVERFREKFIKEARQIATFENSHIVRVIDVFEDNGTAYYVMDYLDGKSLEAIVREQGSLAEADAVKYIRNIADALSEVHARNFLHLDIKPANIMLSRKGQAVLIDFGISKHYDDSGNQTSSGLMAFSDGYAPLEQYNRGGLSDFTPAIDIYALGATLFKLLTGMTPPHASVINNDGLPVLPQEISPAVRNAVETAMQPRRKDRPQSIADFLALLDNVAPRTGMAVAPGVVAETQVFADNGATQIAGAPVHDVPPAPSKQTPPPAVETPRRDAPAPERKSRDNRSENPKKSKAPLFLLLLLIIVVIAGGAWYVSNSNDEPGNGSNTNSNKQSQKVKTPKTGSAQPNSGAGNKYGNENVTPADSVGQMCSLALTTNPDGATVKIDGKEVGTTPLIGYEVEQGKHTINIIKVCYVEYEDTIDLDSATKDLGVIKLKKYDKTYSFSEGLAMVRLNGKRGFIDKSGNVVIPLKYDDAGWFSEGLVWVKLGGKCGFIDKNGNVVIPFKYSEAYEFYEGLTHVYLNHKCGFIDKRGNVVAPFKYSMAWSFSEGRAKVDLDGKYGFIDKNGNEVVPCKYDRVLSFSEGRAAVELDDKWGFIDKNDNMVIPLKYDYASSFSEGLAWVRLKSNKYGFIDKSGKEVIQCKYDDAEDFSGGRAKVRLDGRDFYIDKSGNEIK